MQRWTGEFKYMDDILTGLVHYVHALTRHMCYPPAEASIALLRLMTIYALSCADFGNSFGGVVSDNPVEGFVRRAKGDDKKQLRRTTTRTTQRRPSSR